jgi:cell division protein FtsL
MGAPMHARPLPGRRAPEREEAPALRVVPPRRRLRAGPTIVLGGLLAFATAFVLVALQTLLVQGQSRLDQFDTRIAEATDQQADLRLEVAELESPERIVAAATSLGMVPPPGVTYLTPSGLVTVPPPDTGTADVDATGMP